MAALILRLVAWDLSRKRARLGVMVLTIATTLITYVIFGAILDDVATRAMQMWRTESPYDIKVLGQNVTQFAEDIRTMRGVVGVDAVEYVDAIIGSSPVTLLVLHGDSLFSLECTEGQAPISGSEIAIPASWVQGNGVTLGTEMRILPVETGALAKTFAISGFLANKSRVPQQPLITAQGAQELARGSSRKSALLVALDGKTSITSVQGSIQALARYLEVTTEDDQYSSVQRGMGFADTLLSSMRGLVLLVTAAVLGVLTHLTQRERAYQNGVLRAMGLPQAWLLVAPIVEGLLAFTIGGGLALSFLPFITKQLGLLAGAASAIEMFMAQAGIFMGLGLAFILISSLSTAYKPITSLLRDVWGK